MEVVVVNGNVDFTCSNRAEQRPHGSIQVLINRCDGGQQFRLVVCFPQRKSTIPEMHELGRAGVRRLWRRVT